MNLWWKCSKQYIRCENECDARCWIFLTSTCHTEFLWLSSRVPLLIFSFVCILQTSTISIVYQHHHSLRRGFLISHQAPFEYYWISEMYSQSKPIDYMPLLMIQLHRKCWKILQNGTHIFENILPILRILIASRVNKQKHMHHHKVMTFSQISCRVWSNRVHLLWFENIRILQHISSWKHRIQWQHAQMISFDLIKNKKKTERT